MSFSKIDRLKDGYDARQQLPGNQLHCEPGSDLSKDRLKE